MSSWKDLMRRHHSDDCNSFGSAKTGSLGAPLLATTTTKDQLPLAPKVGSLDEEANPAAAPSAAVPVHEGVPGLSVQHSSGAELKPVELLEWSVLWTDREYRIENVPEEMLGGILYSGLHKAMLSGSYLAYVSNVQRDAPLDIYVFCHKGREAGYSTLRNFAANDDTWTEVFQDRPFWWRKPGSMDGAMLAAWHKRVHWADLKEAAAVLTIEIPTKHTFCGGLVVKLDTPVSQRSIPEDSSPVAGASSLSEYKGPIDAMYGLCIKKTEVERRQQAAQLALHSQLCFSSETVDIQPIEMQDWARLWTDRPTYHIENVPDELKGATLFRMPHSSLPSGHFEVIAESPGVQVYLFAESGGRNRHGQVESLNIDADKKWRKVPVECFGWRSEYDVENVAFDLWVRELVPNETFNIHVKAPFVGGVATTCPESRSMAMPVSPHRQSLVDRVIGFRIRRHADQPISVKVDAQDRLELKIAEKQAEGVWTSFKREQQNIKDAEVVDFFMNEVAEQGRSLRNQPFWEAVQTLCLIEQQFMGSDGLGAELFTCLVDEVNDLMVMPSKADMDKFYASMTELSQRVRDWTGYGEINMLEDEGDAMALEEFVVNKLEKFVERYSDFDILIWACVSQIHMVQKKNFASFLPDNWTVARWEMSQKKHWHWATLGSVAGMMIARDACSVAELALMPWQSALRRFMQSVVVQKLPAFTFQMSQYKGVLVCKADEAKQARGKMIATIATGMITGGQFVATFIFKKYFTASQEE